MLTFADIADHLNQIAAMPKAPCGVMVHPSDYSKFREVFDEVMPSEPTWWTPIIPVEVSSLGEPGKVVLFYDRAMFRAFCELNRPSAVEEADYD